MNFQIINMKEGNKKYKIKFTKTIDIIKIKYYNKHVR